MKRSEATYPLESLVRLVAVEQVAHMRDRRVEALSTCAVGGELLHGGPQVDRVRRVEHLARQQSLCVAGYGAARRDWIITRRVASGRAPWRVSVLHAHRYPGSTDVNQIARPDHEWSTPQTALQDRRSQTAAA